jgi:hypothetical protein
LGRRTKTNTPFGDHADNVLGQTPSIQAAAAIAETVSAINAATLFRLPA